MGKRSTSRRLAMQAVFQAEVGGLAISDAVANILSSEKFIPETASFARELAEATWRDRQINDQLITNLAVDWPLERISKVDLSILRLAFQELRDGVNPPSVVINEAVELAKKFSSAESAKFINGILGTYVRSRPAAA